jgi:transcriptional regulator with XRE-family HTH domain
MIAAQHIKDLRLQHSYTQNYIADELNVSQKTYSNMESGKSKITLEHLTKLSGIYKITLVEFIALVNQVDSKTITAIKKENPDINNSELLDGIHIPIDYILQLKGRIDDLKELMESKDKTISRLKIEIETLKKEAS